MARDYAFQHYPILGKAHNHQPLVGVIYSEDEIWSCTTCGACEEECPLLIEYIDKIADTWTPGVYASPCRLVAQSDRIEWHEPLAFNPDGWRPLSVLCSGGPVYGGWWRFQDQLVRTKVSDLRPRIPARARQESRLAKTGSFR